MTRIGLVVAFLVGCGGARTADRSPDPPDHHEPFEGHLDEPQPVAEPRPEPELVELPPADIGDDVVAPTNPSAQSAGFFDDGARAYNLGDFRTATDAFEHAYESEPHTVYLFDLGQAYRLLGDAKSALFFYKRYAALAEREGGNTIDVRSVIRELEDFVQPD